MTFKWPPIDPDEVLDYSHDWSARLDTDTIQGNPVCEITSGNITIDSNTIVGNIQTVWLSGGVIGNVTLILRVTTTGGRVYEEKITLQVKER